MEEDAAAEDAAGARKRKRGVVEGVEEQDEKGMLLAAAEDDEEEGCYEGIAEEAVAEVMRWLEAAISGDAPAPPRGEEDEPLGFVTINGNEESCGPSFSCAASTVMASVDTRAAAPPPPPVPWPWPLPEASAKRPDADEAWLAELLACVPLLEGLPSFSCSTTTA